MVSDSYLMMHTIHFFGLGSLDQPTPFDAYLQTSDGRRLADLPTPSKELGVALNNSLWCGRVQMRVKANGGVKPKMYTPARYESGSSTSHLDEATFSSKSGADSVMTPSLDPGEIFKEPGPLLLAMMEDMRSKPPVWYCYRSCQFLHVMLKHLLVIHRL